MLKQESTTQSKAKTSTVSLLQHNLNYQTLCIQCMYPKGNALICPHCGHNERFYKTHPLYLKPKTLLKGQYLIGKPLGQGGFGITYIGLDTWLQKRVAIKEYLPATLATRDFKQGLVIPLKKQEKSFNQGLTHFINEARNLAKFDHPHIVRVINFFEENQTGYTVMEYLEGQNLAEILQQQNEPLPLSTTLDIIFPILDALMTVHAQKIYHRDISAHNIHISTNNTPILIDFGAARHIIGENSHSLDLVLKPGYSPIEQYSNKGKIGPWTDIYACGALLYLMLSSHLPSPATDRYDEDYLQPLTYLPDYINDAMMRALAVKWEERFTQITDFKAALQGETIPYPPISSKHSNPEKSTLEKKIRSGIILLIFLVVLLIGYTQTNYFQSADLIKQADRQWQQQKLIKPIGDNVYETYQHLLERFPDHPTGKQGLRKLANHYFELAQRAQNQGQLQLSQQHIKQGLQILPYHEELLKLEKTLDLQISKQATEKKLTTLLNRANHFLTISQLKAAYNTYQQILQIKPHHSQAQTGLEQTAKKYEQLAKEKKTNPKASLFIINQGLNLFPNHLGLLSLQKELQTQLSQQQETIALLQKAENHIDALQLTEPKGENAYEIYQQILNKQPNQPQALNGLQKIANAYEQLAMPEQGIISDKKFTFIEKGLRIQPQHSGLLHLKKQYLQQTTPSVTPPPANPDPLALKVAEWLNQAQKQFELQDWPAAYHHYQKVLNIKPDHAVAQQGLEKIAQMYSESARHYYMQSDLQTSLAIIQQGLEFYPKNQTLLTLKTKVKNQLAESESKSEPQPESKPEVTAKEDATESQTDTSPLPDSQPQLNKSLIFTPSF